MSSRGAKRKRISFESDEKWWVTFALLSEFLEIYGTYNVPFNYTHFTNEGKEVKLGFWLHQQKKNINNISEDKYFALSQLAETGLLWTSNDEGDKKVGAAHKKTTSIANNVSLSIIDLCDSSDVYDDDADHVFTNEKEQRPNCASTVNTRHSSSFMQSNITPSKIPSVSLVHKVSDDEDDKSLVSCEDEEQESSENILNFNTTFNSHSFLPNNCSTTTHESKSSHDTAVEMLKEYQFSSDEEGVEAPTYQYNQKHSSGHIHISRSSSDDGALKTALLVSKQLSQLSSSVNYDHKSSSTAYYYANSNYSGCGSKMGCGGESGRSSSSTSNSTRDIGTIMTGYSAFAYCEAPGMPALIGIGKLSKRSALSSQYKLTVLMAPLDERNIVDSLYYREIQMAIMDKSAILAEDISFELVLDTNHTRFEGNRYTLTTEAKATIQRLFRDAGSEQQQQNRSIK